jgi:spermidine synthase
MPDAEMSWPTALQAALQAADASPGVRPPRPTASPASRPVTLSASPDSTAPADSAESAEHARPFVHEDRNGKALHFSIGAIQSRMQTEDPHSLDLAYTQTMMGFLLFKPEPQNIAMIGLGGGSMAKFCHRHLPGTRLQVVEINPHVIALRDEFQVPPDDDRFKVLRADGAQFVRHRSASHDVLLVDGFDSVGIPSRLSSQRFYDDCYNLLQPGGVMAVNLHFGDPRYLTLLDRIHTSFDDAVLVVDDGEQCNTIAFACKGHTFARYRTGIMRHPKGLAPQASEQLLAAFALIASALKDLPH